MACVQISPRDNPPDQEEGSEALSSVQQTMLQKLGPDALPITLRVSPYAPPSVRLRPARDYHGSPLGVTYDLKVFVGQRPEEKPLKRHMVRMTLSCRHAEPDPTAMSLAPPPRASVNRAFVFSGGRLRVEASLDRETYRPGEMVRAHVTLDNRTNRTVHRVRVLLVQHVRVCMFTNGSFKNLVGLAETEEGHPVGPGASFSRDFSVKPGSVLKFPVALALEGALGGPDDCLASSTRYGAAAEKNPYGVTVSYEAKVKIILGYVDRPVVLHLPFTFLASEPLDQPLRTDTLRPADSCESIAGELSKLVMLRS